MLLPQPVMAENDVDNELLDYEDDEVENAAGAEGAEAPPKKDVKGSYVSIHSSGFRDFLLKPELLRAIVDCGFEHPSEGGGCVGGSPGAVLGSLGQPWGCVCVGALGQPRGLWGVPRACAGGQGDVCAPGDRWGVPGAVPGSRGPHWPHVGAVLGCRDPGWGRCWRVVGVLQRVPGCWGVPGVLWWVVWC